MPGDGGLILGIDSLNVDSLKGLVLPLLARIDELSGQKKKLPERISIIPARIVELETRAGNSPKPPINSALPPSRGRKAPPNPRYLCRALRLPCEAAPSVVHAHAFESGSGARI
jgi:hypothetical protein